MGIALDKDYTIKNSAGLEIDVPGRTLVERALANEPDTIDGVPIREFVRNSVDVKDSVAEAHEQGVSQNVPLPDAKAEAKRIADIRQTELDIVLGVAVANPEDDNLPDDDVLDNADQDTDGVPDRLEE